MWLSRCVLCLNARCCAVLCSEQCPGALCRGVLCRAELCRDVLCRAVLCSDCCYAEQGPPGTGKTTTIIQFVAAALKVLPPKTQLLAVSASNVAVDNLLTGFAALGIRVVRIGRGDKVRVCVHSQRSKGRRHVEVVRCGSVWCGGVRCVVGGE
jgi:AAA domain